MKRWLRVVLALGIALVAALELPAASAQTSVGPTTVTLNPVADSYVYAAQPTVNFGANAALRTDSSPLLRSYLRFDVQGVTGAQSVALRVFAETGNNLGIELHTVADTSWTESGITFNNAPAIGAAIASSGPISAGTWVTFDVSEVVTSDGLVSFAISSPSSTATRFSSRSGANKPELAITTGGGPPRYVVTRTGDTYSAQSQSTGTTFSGTLKSAVERAVADLQTSGGGEVAFGAGTFDFGADYFRFVRVDDVTFSGAGIGLTVLQNVSSADADTEPFNFEASDRITIRDMTVSAGGPVRTTSDALDFDGGDDILIERVEVIQARGRGIVFDGKDDPNVTGGTALRNVVRDCVITGGVAKSGIELLAAAENRIEGCVITDVGGHGIHVNKSGATAFQPNKPSTDNVIVGNTITNAAIDGVNVSSGHRNRILQNTILNSSDDLTGRGGIWIASAESGLACDANVVEGNTASDNQSPKTQRYGLAIAHAQCTANVVGNNDFSGNISVGLHDLGTNTVYTDTSAPTAPSNLHATGVTTTSVTLAWGASSDNYAVAGYRVRRDGVQVGGVAGQTLTFTDSSAAPATTYTYAVVAFDRAGNESAGSNAVIVTTAAPATVTLNPVADAYVYDAQPDANFGSNAALRTDSSPVLRSYLRFEVQGVAGAQSVLLRVFAETGNTQGIELHPVTDTSWTESGITFNNAPAIGAPIASSGPITAGSWVTFDVTGVVTGDGSVSFAITSPSSTATRLSSRSGANKPELVLRSTGT